MQHVTVSAMRDLSMAVVEDVNWTVAPGEYWIIAGLQGSGKSDFMMMTAGLMPPAEGNYLLFGEQMPIFHDQDPVGHARHDIHFVGHRQKRVAMVLEIGRAHV